GFERAHALSGERVAVEHRDQFHGALHVAAVIENDQQVRRIVGGHLRTFAQERLQQLFQVAYRGVLEEDHVHDDALIIRQIPGIDLGRIGQRCKHVDGNDAVQVADLYHGGAVDAQNRFHERHELSRLDLAVSMNGDSAADLRVQNVIDLHAPREDVDQLDQRDVVQQEAAAIGER